MAILREILKIIVNWLRGFLFSVFVMYSRIKMIIKDGYYEKKLGINTTGNYSKKEEMNEFEDDEQYEPTPYLLLKEIKNELRFKKSDVFVDLGCGKGRVPIYFSSLNIRKTIGLELKKSLIEIAQNNVKRLKQKHCEIEIIHQDVLKYNFDEGTIFFMFNPFGWKTMRKVIKKFKASYKKNKRNITIIYFCPASQLLFLIDDDFKLLKRIKKHNQSVAMYRMG